MKKIVFSALLATSLLSACSKKDSVIDPADNTSATSAATPAIMPLSAGFTITDQNNAKEGSAISFHNTSVSGVSYKWDFGNGRTSTEKEPQFTYPVCGTYNVQLFVTDANGQSTAASHELEVNCIFRAPGAPPVSHAPLF